MLTNSRSRPIRTLLSTPSTTSASNSPWHPPAQHIDGLSTSFGFDHPATTQAIRISNNLRSDCAHDGYLPPWQDVDVAELTQDSRIVVFNRWSSPCGCCVREIF